MNDSSKKLEKDIDNLINTLKGNSSQSSRSNYARNQFSGNKVVIPPGFHEVKSFAPNKDSTPSEKVVIPPGFYEVKSFATNKDKTPSEKVVIPPGFHEVKSFATEAAPEYKESTTVKIIGKSISAVSSVKESVSNIVGRAKAKNLVNDLEMAARAKIAIEELTDSRKPLKIEASSTPSIADEIRKLADLRDEGIISEREFQDLKYILINR
ncbi:SHOCT domain-containing protein [Succinivibrio sp.]|uniref:SHOCT domain-containing protein n=1 Tax=Succinivibrio sp. TaxID=2053619 RepID=UPI00386AB7B5